MAGLVAIVADRPGVHVPGRALDGLVACYRCLRGEPERVRLTARRAAVALLGDGAGGIGFERDGRSWAAYVGGPHIEHGSALTAEPRALDGQFALLRYDDEAERTELLSDPFGLQAIYVAQRDGLTYVSTSALALAKHLRAQPDRVGLEVFLRAGPHFGELTNWGGIRRVAPATLGSHDARGAASTTYWRPSVDATVAKLGLEAAARACVDAAVATYRDRFARAERAWCDLSGGYDTRLGALLLDRAGVRFATNTNGPDQAADTVIARRVAALAGWECARGRVGAGWAEACEAALPRALAWGDGMLEATHLALVLALQARRAGDGAVLFNGGGGEHWRDYAWKQEMPFGGRTTTVRFDRWVGVRFLHPVDSSVFKRDPTPQVRANLIERCRAYVEPYAHELNSVQLDILYAYKAMAHFGAYQSASRGTIHVELPFYAKPAFVAAFSVAPRHRDWHRLARVAIEMLDPRIAALRTTHGDLATPLRLRNAHRFTPFLSNRARGAARKLTQNLPGPTLGTVAVARSEPVERARRATLDRFIRETGLDTARMRSGALYDAGALRRLAHSGAATSAGWTTLGPIITVERALRIADAEVP